MNDNGINNMYYIHKDYLGSYETITDSDGNIVEKLSFDPWGRRRNPTDWSFTDISTSFLFDRGFTGHEHLDNFDMINMNGRVYDPWLGRFISHDPFVQSPTYSQNYNRYSYALNNPLKYVDPSGYDHQDYENLTTSSGGGGNYDYDSDTFTPYTYSMGNPYLDVIQSHSAHSFNASHGFSYGKISYRNGKYMNTWTGNEVSFNEVTSTLNSNNFTVGVLSGVIVSMYTDLWASNFIGYDVRPFEFNLITSENGISINASSGGDIIYKEGSYSFSDFNLQYLAAEGKGLLGGWSRVRGSANVYRGKDGIYYANVSAIGFTPSNSQGNVTFSGNVEVYSGGNLVGTQRLNRLGGSSIIQSGWQNVGQGTIALPNYGSDVYLRFNVGYNYSEGAGSVSPWPAQGHSNLYIPHFVIDAWTY